MQILVWIFQTIIGLIFGLLSILALSPAIASIIEVRNGVQIYVSIIIAMISILLCFFAPSIRRAFGRGFLFLGCAVWALPISALLLSGRSASEVISTSEGGQGAGEIIGAGMAVVAITGVAAFVGFFFGTILLIIGIVLSLGGKKEVVIIERNIR